MPETPAPGDQITANVGPGATNVNVGKNINQTVYHFAPARAIDAATLAAAHDRLAALPVDTIPPVATLPTGSRLPLTPNPLFVGRQAALQTLARTLKGGATVAIGPATVAAATGGGGYGKTQLAVEFAHRYGQYFAGGVFWLNFASAAGVTAEIATCGGAGFLDLRPDYAALPLADQVNLVLAAWQDGQPYLLIFDNCEDPTLLKRWRPATGTCRILITSRRATWDRTLQVQPLPLGVLARPESVTLLQRFLADQPPDAAILTEIAAELGDLPLALHLAGSFLDRYQTVVTPAAYLAQLRRADLLHHRSLISGDLSPTDHEQHVARTFALSYDRLDTTEAVDQLALKLLARAAHFAPGVPIPRALLLASGGIDAADAEAMIQATDALHRLVELGLLESEADGALRLHRLVARFVQTVSADGAQMDVETTILHESNELYNAGNLLPLVAWQSHMGYVTNQARSRRDARSASLCNNWAEYLNMIGELRAAKNYVEEALAIQLTVFGEHHLNTTRSLNDLGFLLQDQGELTAARPYYEQALAIRQHVLGDQHPDTASSLNNLGFLLQDQGDLSAARPYYEQALAIFEQRLGPQHPKTQVVRGNLESLLAG